MKKNQINKTLALLAFLVVSLLFGACSKRPDYVLAEQDMVSLLVDIHTLEGVLVEKSYQYGNDSIKSAYYAAVFLKHGVKQSEFDSSLVWYTRQPRYFEVIYKQVVERLEKQDKLVKSGYYHPQEFAELSKTKINIWNKRASYRFTPDSVRTRLNFSIANQNFMLGDVFTLGFLQRIAPADSSLQPFVLLRINYKNGEYQYVSARSKNDSILRRFTLRLPATKRQHIVSVTGCLLGNRAYKGKFRAYIDSVSLTRTFNPVQQDSLRKLLPTADSIKVPKSKKIRPRVPVEFKEATIN